MNRRNARYKISGFELAGGMLVLWRIADTVIVGWSPICCQWHFNGRFPIALHPTMTYTAAWNMLLLTFFYCSVSHGPPNTDLHKWCATNIKDFLVKNLFLKFSLRVTGLPRSWMEGLYLLKRDKVGEVTTMWAIILLQDGRSAKVTKSPVTYNCFP